MSLTAILLTVSIAFQLVGLGFQIRAALLSQKALRLARQAQDIKVVCSGASLKGAVDMTNGVRRGDKTVYPVNISR